MNTELARRLNKCAGAALLFTSQIKDNRFMVIFFPSSVKVKGAYRGNALSVIASAFTYPSPDVVQFLVRCCRSHGTNQSLQPFRDLQFVLRSSAVLYV